MRKQLVMSVIVAVCCLPGCVFPDFSPQGTIYQQRNSAVLHDPFPTNLGPTIEGARPLEFDRPLAEPTDLQTKPRIPFRF